MTQHPESVTEYVKYDSLVDFVYGNDHSCPVSEKGWSCTRPTGHTGVHVAGVGGNKITAAWPNEKEKTVSEGKNKYKGKFNVGDRVKVIKTFTTTEVVEGEVHYMGLYGDYFDILVAGKDGSIAINEDQGYTFTAEKVTPAVPKVLPVGTVVLYNSTEWKNDVGPFVQTHDGWKHLISGRVPPGRNIAIAREALASAVRKGDAKITFDPTA